MRAPLIAAALLGLGLAATACSGDDDDEPAATDAAADAVTYDERLEGTGPIAGDHWHQAYAFHVCDPASGEMQFRTLSGNKEELDKSGRPISERFVSTGIHSHDDGVIHWHPFSAEATGTNARLDVFLDVYDVELTDTELTFPPDQGDVSYVEGETMCGDEPGELSVTVWPDFNDVDTKIAVTEGLAGTPVRADGQVHVVSFAPAGTEIPQPEWAPDLPELGARDGG